jgi:hypothetical protein
MTETSAEIACPQVKESRERRSIDVKEVPLSAYTDANAGRWGDFAPNQSRLS